MSTCNAKILGTFYIVAGFLLGLAGMGMSVLMRIELSNCNNMIIAIQCTEFYNTTITLHALTMVFFMVMPVLYGGYGNLCLPLQIGSGEVCYPRMNNGAFWLVPVSYIVMMMSVIVEHTMGPGWTMYPPLSTSIAALSPVGVDCILMALLIVGTGSTMSAMNFIGTATLCRAVGMNFVQMPAHVHSIVVASVLLLICLPVLAGALIMLTTDRHMNSCFFDNRFGGDALLYQHLFWFFGHPEVYILILPGFGGVSQAMMGFLGLPNIVGVGGMIASYYSIGALGLVVWGHHMFIVGMDADTVAYFSGVTLLIAVPTSTKIFNWLTTWTVASTNNATAKLRPPALGVFNDY